MPTDIIVYTLRTIAVTEHQWISMTATTVEDESITSVEQGRRENLRTLHRNLATPPPMGVGPTTWREPHDDTKVIVHDTLIKQDLVTGLALDERELEKYTISYSSMANE